MLNFYSDEETALQLLQNYAYNTENPSNPNAHIYLYEYQKQNKASPAQLVNTLKVRKSALPAGVIIIHLYIKTHIMVCFGLGLKALGCHGNQKSFITYQMKIWLIKRKKS